MLACLVLLWLPGTTFSLGVGDIEVKSALNQPLKAEISLYSIRPSELDSLHVSLATRGEFKKAGVPRPFLLTKLRFAIDQKADGTPYIKVTTRNPVREPFLDFLVDVSWRSGRLLREYTILLDPPVIAAQRARAIRAPVSIVVSTPEVAAPVAVAAPEVDELPMPTPVDMSVDSDEVSVVSDSGEDDLFPRMDIGDEAAPVTLDEVTDSRAASRTAKTAKMPAYDGDTYGPVVRKDTLWSIASKVRPDDSIDMAQMMLALLKENPEAFNNANIHGLKAGAILRIPERDAIMGTSKDIARQDVQAQNMAWKNIPVQTESAEKITRKPAGQAAPVVSEPAVASKPEVKLISPREGEGAVGSGTSKEVERIRQELALANEALASSGQENSELKARMTSLEDQLDNMQRLLTLKDNDLARLQKSLSDIQKEIPEPVTAAPAASTTTAAATVADTEVTKDTEVGKDTETETNPYAVETTPDVVSEPVAEVDSTSQPETSPVVKPTPAPVVTEPTGLMADIMADPVKLGGLVIVVLVLGGLGWTIARRRGMADMDFPESILRGRPLDAGSDTPSEDTSLLSDFASTSIGAESEVGEVDPLAEADVFIAYKRYSQAEEMLKQALRDEPERADLKLKLMEVYAATEDTGSFEGMAQELHDSLDSQSGALWEKAVTLGREVCPDNPLFGGGFDESLDDDFMAESSGGETATDELTESSLTDEEMADAEDIGVPDLDIPEAAAEAGVESAADDALADLDLDLDMDFDTGADTSTGEDSAEELVSADDDLAGLDLDLDSMDLGDFDVSAEKSAEELTEGLGDLEFDVPVTDDSAAEEPSAASAIDEPSDSELSELTINLDEAPAEAAAEVTAEESDVESTVDEVATKLDLARAYIDMGDPDGARSILEEVLNEGSDQQKKDAEELLSQV
ncbi:MAG: motility hub landmark protein FimV [Gammaproteobacteria bacterium]|nr:MAG: motility hub landmark protein FimV [Gammaproteobacteria bacterium]